MIIFYGIKYGLWDWMFSPKVRVLLWRLCRKAVPTYGRLNRRINDADPFCKRCMGEEETEFHAIVQCPYAVSVWECAGFEEFVEHNNFFTFGD